MEIRIIGLQKKKNEAHGGEALLRTAIQESISHFRLSHKECISRHHFYSLNTRVLINADTMNLINKNFASIVASLGECCAGDEKLFHFTGDSNTVRLLPGHHHQY